ncbi:hypothetical protein OIV19_21555 [Brucella sp. HL-2]|nr:hypothetical protein [Brucella sp. HL-2]MCV9910185.1 hypothetical protein [Brucella sp. HL-2]
MPATTYTGNKLIDLLVRGKAFEPPARVFIALHTADGGLTGANEMTAAKWPSYTRLDFALGEAVDTGFAVAAAKKSKNLKQLLFPTMDGAASVKITHWSIWDAATGGNCLWTGTLTYDKTLNPTDEVVVHPNELALEVE